MKMTKDERNFITSEEQNCDFHNNNTGDKLLESEQQSKKSDPPALTPKAICAQGLITVAVMINAAACGMPIGYSAILLPQLNNDSTSELHANDNIGSWIASIHSAATPLGSILSGMLMEKFGRKRALQIACVPLIIGWILIALTKSHFVLLLGRFVAGIAVGLSAAAGQVLVGEISSPSVRGIFTSMPFASYSFGILLVYALGATLEWRTVAGLSTLLPTVAMVAFCFLPESPVWLTRKEQTETAVKVLTWLRGGDVVQAKKEMQQIINRLEDEKRHNSSKVSLATFLEPHVLKPFLIVNIFSVLQTLSGTYLVVFYAVDIVRHMNNENMDSFMVAVLTASVRLLFSIVSSVLLAIMGRRTLAISSGVGSAISTLCLSAYLYENANSTGNGHFAVLCILFYVAANTVGFMILPGVIVSELYPAKVRGLAGGLSFTIFNFVLFGIAKIFPLIKSCLDIQGVFLIFGVASVLATLFVYLMLPETKSVSLNEIEDYFHQKNVMWITRKKDSLNKTETA